ncbi:MAG: hypothetical protein HZA01_14460 [Nitrospinae bacterium]|nr:hypothetical protein [Nitrospinota bacterium]
MPVIKFCEFDGIMRMWQLGEITSRKIEVKAPYRVRISPCEWADALLPFPGNGIIIMLEFYFKKEGTTNGHQ